MPFIYIRFRIFLFYRFLRKRYRDWQATYLSDGYDASQDHWRIILAHMRAARSRDGGDHCRPRMDVLSGLDGDARGAESYGLAPLALVLGTPPPVWAT